jgi:hypothetical protein
MVGCGGGGIDTGGGNDGGGNGGDGGNGGNGGDGGNATSATITGSVVTAGGTPAAGVECRLVPITDISNSIATATTDANGEFTFSDVGLDQDLKVRAIDSGNQVEGSSVNFRPAADNSTIELPAIQLTSPLPPAPPW